MVTHDIGIVYVFFVLFELVTMKIILHKKEIETQLVLSIYAKKEYIRY